VPGLSKFAVGIGDDDPVHAQKFVLESEIADDRVKARGAQSLVHSRPKLRARTG